jgi:hypothetical protein
MTLNRGGRRTARAKAGKLLPHCETKLIQTLTWSKS